MPLCGSPYFSLEYESECIMFLSVGFFLVITVSLSSAHSLTDEEVMRWEAPEEVKENFPYYLSGYDEEGAPIFIWEFGKWDLRTYIERSEKDFNDLDIYVDQMILKFRDQGANSTAQQFLCIVDINSWPIRQAGHFRTIQLIVSKFTTFRKVVRSGTLKMIFVINANYLFQQFWSFGKNFLGQLAEKIELYGNNIELWKPKILRYVPRDQIPESFGGTKDHKVVQVFG